MKYEFDKVYNSIILEVSQDMINRTVLKHQTIKDRNPVSKSRANDFFKRAENRAEKSGTLIRTKTDPESRSTYHYNHYYLTSVEPHNQDDEVVILHCLSVDPYESRATSNATLHYSISANTLLNSNKEQLWLLSRTDAQNLSNFIRKQLQVNVSWKAMDFINSGDYSNQYSDTRYDMSKLGK